MDIPSIEILTDFKDYYDSLSVSGGYKYERYKGGLLDKGEGILVLKRLGVETIELKAARDIITRSSKVVVYTDPSRHDGSGRVVMSVDEATLLYPNSLASEYYEEAGGDILKYLQVGSRRFRILISGGRVGLNGGVVESIEELESGYNARLGLPIYSIDYISTNRGLRAITFNNIEDLSLYGLDKYIGAKDVIKEVYDALIKYNKVEVKV